MDTEAHRERSQATRNEYDRLQRRLKKNRRVIYHGSCIVCLLIGSLVGVLIAYPRERTVVVSVEEPAPQLPQADTITL